MEKNEKSRLFVDMDGTLAEFKSVDTLEKLYEEGYFFNLKPQMSVVLAIKEIIKKEPDIEVFILSSVLSDSKYALNEKNKWLDIYLPEIDVSHRIFPPCGEDKKNYIPDLSSSNFLLDDYTKNLTLWEPPCVGIKLLNGINHTHGTWKGRKVEVCLHPDLLADKLIQMINDDQREQKRLLHHPGRSR